LAPVEQNPSREPGKVKGRNFPGGVCIALPESSALRKAKPSAWDSTLNPVFRNSRIPTPARPMQTPLRPLHRQLIDIRPLPAHSG